jgi:hypothetical protein
MEAAAAFHIEGIKFSSEAGSLPDLVRRRIERSA